MSGIHQMVMGGQVAYAYHYYTAAGPTTFTVPANVKRINCLCIGGGGGGGAGADNAGGDCGGAGGAGIVFINWGAGSMVPM